MPDPVSALPPILQKALPGREQHTLRLVHSPPIGRLYPGLLNNSPGYRVSIPLSPPISDRQLVLLGACDRHNLGDLLMPELLTRLLGREHAPTIAGLVTADLREAGGSKVEAFPALSNAWRNQASAQPPIIIHFGGETLGCSLSDGYAMTLDPSARSRFLQMLREAPSQAAAELRSATGLNASFAYLASSGNLPVSSICAHHAVGLAQPGELSPSARKALLRNLESSLFLGVRGEKGADFLEKSGLPVHRMPCVVTALPWLCGDDIAARGPLVDLRERFPKGWIAVQISAYRKKLYAPTARALGDFARTRGLGVVFFAAGTATGHDDPSSMERLALSLPEGTGHFLRSRHIWDLAGVVTGAEMFCGTSLHGRILAMAAGIPRLSLAARFAKIHSYCQLWEHPDLPVEVSPEALPRLLPLLEGQDRALLRRHARWLAQRYLNAFTLMAKVCGLPTATLPSPLTTAHPMAPRG